MEIESDESDAKENEPTDLSENTSHSKEYDEFMPDTSKKNHPYLVLVNF